MSLSTRATTALAHRAGSRGHIFVADYKLDLDLFADNLQPFAAYYEPQGWERVKHATNFSEKLYKDRIPKTAAVAYALLHSVAQYQVWARQSEKVIGSWLTVTEGKWTETKAAVYETDRKTGEPILDNDGDPILRHRARGIVGAEMRCFDTIKHLAGRTLAVGITDRCRHLAIMWENGVPEMIDCYNGIESLKIDTDLDTAFAKDDHATVLAELRNQREIANLLGYPLHAFRTGSRGIQSVIALPTAKAIWMSSASWITLAFKMLADATKQEGAKIDADSLYSIMRLPGGVHGRTRNLGLWIDIDKECLYDIYDQARLMSDAYSRDRAMIGSAVEGIWARGEFDKAAREITNWLEAKGHSALKRLDDHSPLFHEVIQCLPNNPIVSRFVAAANEIAPATLLYKERGKQHDVAEPIDGAALPPGTGLGNIILGGDDEDDNDDHRTSSDIARRPGDLRITHEDARRIWKTGYHMGGSREWHLTKHGNGILAAIILFGKDHALEKLIDKAQKVEYDTNERLQSRLKRINDLWDECQLKHWTAYRVPAKRQKVEYRDLGSLPLLSPEEEQLRDRIVELAGAAKAMKQPVRERLPLVVEVILSLFKGSTDMTIQVSARSIAAAINESQPDAKIGKSTVEELLHRIVQGKPDGISVLVKQDGVYAGGSKRANSYTMGELISSTDFGRAVRRRYRDAITVSDDDEKSG